MNDLTKIYKNGEILHYENLCNKDDIPCDVPISRCNPVIFPPEVIELYQFYWMPAYHDGIDMDVVNYKGKIFMALYFRFGNSMVRDFIPENDTGLEVMEKMYELIYSYAEALSKMDRLSGCEVATGKFATVNYCDLAVFIPYEERHRIKPICKMLGKTVYTDVYDLVQYELVPEPHGDILDAMEDRKKRNGADAQKMQNIDELCHRLFSADGQGKDYLSREGKVFCENCGSRVRTYYCEDRLYLVECECCEKKVLVKAGNPEEAAIKAFHGVW